MISRRTAHALAQVFGSWFGYYKTLRLPYGRQSSTGHIHSQDAYDFLYVNEYPAWLCNSIKVPSSPQALRDWVMGLHTGETQYTATKTWTWEQRQKLGQQHLVTLAQDILNLISDAGDTSRYRNPDTQTLLRNLELDGYTFTGRRIHAPESDVLNVAEERGVLEDLFSRLGLGESETAFHHLSLSEEHYVAQRWDDTISNARKFLECVLAQVAATHSERLRQATLDSSTLDRPVAVRDYLERSGLLESREKEAVTKIYSLLSHTGGHPYMAASDQARLLRQLALTVSQFVMLRLGGSLSGD